MSRDGDWTGWCAFFIEGVKVQAEENLARAEAILRLHDDLKHRLPEMTRSQYAVRALDWIFARPIFAAPDFIRDAGIPAPTARRFLAVLRKNNILMDLRSGRGQRPAVIAFPDLLNIAEGRTVL